MIQMIIMFCPFNMIVVNDDHLMWSQTAASWPVHVSVFPNVVPFSATMGTSATTSSWQQQENAKLTRSYEENMKICQDIAKFAKYDMLLGLIVGHSGHSFWAKFCLHLHVEFASYTQGNHSDTSRGAVKVEGRPSVGPIMHPTYIHSMTNLKP